MSEQEKEPQSRASRLKEQGQNAVGDRVIDSAKNRFLSGGASASGASTAGTAGAAGAAGATGAATVAGTAGSTGAAGAAGAATAATAPVSLPVLGIGAVLFLIIGAMLVLVMACSLLTVIPVQSATIAWPAAVAKDYQPGGWNVSSTFGWRVSPVTGEQEFHDGLDLASRDGKCPFAESCPAVPVFDATVMYIGANSYGSEQPFEHGGGQMVVLKNGNGDMQATYAHLHPYRVLIQLQGKINDAYDDYERYASYQPIGEGELLPDSNDDQWIEMMCANDYPNFAVERLGPGTIEMRYDRPASCTTRVIWGQRNEAGWRGWTPDGPTELSWQTPITRPGGWVSFLAAADTARAKDVALRFRAHLNPPPPEPTATITTTVSPVPLPTGTGTPVPVPLAAQGQGIGSVRTVDGWLQFPEPSSAPGKPRACEQLKSGWQRCVWAVRDLPSREEPAAKTQPNQGHGIGSVTALAPLQLQVAAPAAPRVRSLTTTAFSPSSAPDCSQQPLVRLPGVKASLPLLSADAAESYAQVRAEIQGRTGRDLLAVLSDALRDAAFTTNKAGVSAMSWHKTGRAIDLDQGAAWTRLPEGRYFRLLYNGVDITAIFEAHGWQRIPIHQSGVLEWWHYEWHPDGISWESAMLQVWPIAKLQSAFPQINWAAMGCTGGSGTGTGGAGIPAQPTDPLMCRSGSPSWATEIEEIDGCGPPLHVGDKVYQLDSVVGFVGMTGDTSGPHLHLGLSVRNYDGTIPNINVCTPEQLRDIQQPTEAMCWIRTVDPLEFLPRAPGGNVPGDDGQPLTDGEAYQLPPPGTKDALVLPNQPGASSAGQYYSPYENGGQYGGGGVVVWLRQGACSLFGIGCQ